ncbi:hypothetical protein CN120_28380, partial [Sinorhizobium meliloti]|uniref:hypothetical protein n=1 Tax=Rhizobium meliloti TaxID=382 RepID=UPI000FE0531E
SLDNQKIDGKTPSDGACACDISIHPELSPDSPAASGAKGQAASSQPRLRPLLHVSFNRIRSKDKNMQQIKVLQRPLRV